jgi:hypothetical protein
VLEGCKFIILEKLKAQALNILTEFQGREQIQLNLSGVNFNLEWDKIKPRFIKKYQF